MSNEAMIKEKCARKWDSDKERKKLVEAKSGENITAERSGQCSECLCTIPAGEKHWHFEHEKDGVTKHSRVCERCDKIRLEMCPASPIGKLDQDLRECYGVGIDGGDGIGAYMGNIALPWSAKGEDN